MSYFVIWIQPQPSSDRLFTSMLQLLLLYRSWRSCFRSNLKALQIAQIQTYTSEKEQTHPHNQHSLLPWDTECFTWTREIKVTTCVVIRQLLALLSKCLWQPPKLTSGVKTGMKTQVHTQTNSGAITVTDPSEYVFLLIAYSRRPNMDKSFPQAETHQQN